MRARACIEAERITRSLSRRSGKTVLLSVVTCGVFGLYVEYRNVQKVHAALFSREPTRTDQSQLVGIR